MPRTSQQPPEVRDVGKVWKVREIIQKKKSGRKVFYLIDWVGCALSDATWEPAAHLNYHALKSWREHGENKERFIAWRRARRTYLWSSRINAKTTSEKTKFAQMLDDHEPEYYQDNLFIASKSPILAKCEEAEQASGMQIDYDSPGDLSWTVKEETRVHPTVGSRREGRVTRNANK